ncbi:bifunctional UDP-N-acetylglucosamine diphosphorylase/glucosamine-1-phosphate N-acetyltransferase GlmU [Sphingomicrobium clamense]|uniref:Bifunctional protein GlmU n=1 Tax=Sphingomicrobium clamense TaxID=2851013 RepID=A0ABS6V598_9SPHN|nr:bifunctional UDP-N-acetylglucosamine diphosphorylase/glucosamine-1-phosphate N-acetyltransferase GlmU [Sphingomicrobium sp. B8]MBW0144735.1 bifunctional UDP-N-acetylglucosamine diphosphorylase/glucosamine-1-phosphate N-acetyltransferase GlmU [Sphingomicrobium sp. B8]
MSFAVVILAAGQGSRMKSRTHKVLHPIADKPMLMHLLDTVEAMGSARNVVVVGQSREQVEGALADRDVAIAVQEEQKGTGHAVLMARDALADYSGPIVVLYGDVPFVGRKTLETMVARLGERDAPGVVVLASSPEDPKAYGRVILGEGDRIAKMVEYKDANEAERACRLCNSGMMAVESASLWGWLDRVGNDNAAGEYYLPDVVMLAQKDGRTPVAVEADPVETTGINSRIELAEAEAQFQQLAREDAMAAGVTLRDPASVFFSHDTKLAPDVIVEPNVVFGPGVSVGAGSRIRAFSHLEGASVGEGCEVGPYARLRPGAVMETGSKVGNFVEMKKATLGEGAKANHLTYLGDATVGAGANIGAGTITCNYDGFGKYKTEIGEGAFIGSNSSLVAPVTIGKGAIVGAGSVITKNVDEDSLGVARGDQRGLAGWAAKFREKMKKE